MNDGFCLLNASGEVIRVNAQFERMMDMQRANLIGRGYRSAFAQFQDTTLLAELAHALELGATHAFEFHCPALMRWFVVNIIPARDINGVAWFQQDITAQKHAEQAVARLARLQAVTAALGRGLCTREVANILLDQGVQMFGAGAGIVLRRVEGEPFLRVVSTVNYPDALVAAWQTCPLSRELPVPFALRTGEALFLESPAEIQKRFPEMTPIMEATGIQSFAAFPLCLNGQPIAAAGFSFLDARAVSPEIRCDIDLSLE